MLKDTDVVAPTVATALANFLLSISKTWFSKFHYTVNWAETKGFLAIPDLRKIVRSQLWSGHGGVLRKSGIVPA